jgi:succinate dehydrogenase/fumarate reductase flavoprotein subunit
MDERSVEVLIVGGGAAGVISSLALAQLVVCLGFS